MNKTELSPFPPSGGISVKDCNLWYGDFQALKEISMEIPEKQITALIGPSGCGKSTFLKIFNRMNDLVAGCRITGQFLVGGKDIFAKDTDVTLLRKQVGMVFQKPNPFPMSVYDNVAFAPRTFGIRKKSELDAIVERSLKRAGIFEEAKDRLHKSALGMSGGQQQRLCIARALVNEPPVIFADEPTGNLDTATEQEIIKIFRMLTEEFGKTVIVVTHSNVVSELSDHRVVLNEGQLKDIQ